MIPTPLLPFSALVVSRQTDDRARECIPAQELERRLRSCTYCFRDPCVCASTKYGAALQNEDFSTWLKRQDLVRYKPLALALRPGVWCSQTAMQSKYVEREYENARLEGVNRLLHARVRTRARACDDALRLSEAHVCNGAQCEEQAIRMRQLEEQLDSRTATYPPGSTARLLRHGTACF